MATLNIGSVSAIAMFAKRLSRAEREESLRDYETAAEEGGRCLQDKIADRFASLCDFALKRVLSEAQSSLKTLRVEVGYGYAEHRKDWLRLGCELMVEEDEAQGAVLFLQDPSNAGVLDSRIEEATREFIDSHFRSAVFPELSCSFYLLDNPENA